MSYKVIRSFADGTDKGADYPNGFLYSVGDVYPRSGYEPSEDFLQSLLNGRNTTGSIFIAYDEEPPIDVQEAAQETPKIEKKTRSRKKKDEVGE
ncbi:hypothetical protein BU202_08215 [Streptococcus cuniculi]|uniref:Uncharacterized protein n=1 Tax=Streptococcus cuniculi TaxID=1432788 RepID=A0A1Q8E6A2_9STRE|nr:hypothetical protein [Streptococcus cuniculi]OLF47301.1 hypothetical protein BU202_08215 [Streptococcus cuniculi]QBX23154.1 transcriptional terminator [Streptococcus phage Javan116]